MSEIRSFTAKMQNGGQECTIGFHPLSHEGRATVETEWYGIDQKRNSVREPMTGIWWRAIGHLNLIHPESS